MSRATFGKPLKGVGTLSSKFNFAIEQAVLDTIQTGGIPIDNVEINGGTIDGVVIGGNLPGPGYFTTLQSGSPGQGYSVCFFGETVGDEACWEPVVGRWNIQGELLVRDISDLGNLRISSNTISSTTTNGNINIDPNGSGILQILSGVNQSSPTGVVNFNSSQITLTSSSDINLSAAADVNIPDNVGLTFGNDIRKIESNGTDITVSTGTGKLIVNGDLVVNGDTTKVESTVTTIKDPVLTLGGDIPLISDDNKDRGIEFRYYSGGQSRLGFFGYDDSTSAFTYLLDATNTNEVFTGTPGDAVFGNLTLSSLNTCNITCAGDLTLNGGTGIILNSTNVKTNDPILTLGGVTPPLTDDNKDRGIEFRYHDGTTSKLGFFGYDDSQNAFTFIPDATNTNEVISGAPGNVVFGNVTVTGTITAPSIPLSTEHLSLTGGSSANPSSSINMTFITITSTGICTGTLLAPTVDGFQKFILITALFTGSRYELSCPAGRLVDPGSGTTNAKKITFEYSGQSLMIIWDNIASRYIVINGNACIGSP